MVRINKTILTVVFVFTLLLASAQPVHAAPPNNIRVVEVQESISLYFALMMLPINTDSISVSCVTPDGKTVTFGLIAEEQGITNIQKVHERCGNVFAGPYVLYITLK